MPNRAHRSNTQKPIRKKSEPNSPTTSAAAPHGGILSLPSEILTQITASLDPKSLLALGRVNRQLRDHVTDDHTWGIAFKAQCLKLSPEAEPSQTDLLLLRRCETSWRKELLKRWNLNRCFVKSRNATISHSPVNSIVSDVILLPDKSSVLASSLMYGIVSRSFAFTGKILKGYFDAHGTFNGQGIGNPNGEFAPDVCAITLHGAGGGAAKIAWGFLSGEVALTIAPKAIELGKIAKFVRCRPAEAHESMVSALTFGETHGASGSTFVSASIGGTIKLWESRRMKCLWTESIQDASPATATPAAGINTVLGVKRLSYCAISGIVVALGSNGDIFVWAGFDTQQVIESSQSSDAGAFQPISPQYYGRLASPEDGNGREPLSIVIQPLRTGSRDVHIAVFYTHTSHFWKVVASPSPSNPSALEFFRTKFVAGPVGELTSNLLSFSQDPPHETTLQAPPSPQLGVLSQNMSGFLPPQPRRTPPGSRHRSFVLAGDSLGQLVLWDWENDTEKLADPTIATGRKGKAERQFCRQLLAHEDGALSAIAMDGPILATGSNGGSIKLWDSLTFEHIRTFAASSVRSPQDLDHERVSRLILRDDVMIASIGNRIFAWKAVVTKTDKAVKHRGKKTSQTRVNPMSKWQEQVELRSELRESSLEIDEEHRELQESYGREREQRQTLAQLGLDEVEAVEYVLMLSRDEERAKQASLLSSIGEDGSIASSSASQNPEDDLLFDDFDMSFPTPSRIMPTRRDKDRPQSTSASPTSSRCASVSSHSYTTPIPSPRHTPSLSPISYSPAGSTKIQVSPRQRPEPAEAGSTNMGMSVSPLNIGRSNAWQIPSHPGALSLGNSTSGSRGVSASVGDRVSVSFSWPASTSSTPPAFRASSSVGLSTLSMTSVTGQRSWSDVARSSSSTGAISSPSGQGQPPTSGSRVVQGQHPSRSLLSASLLANPHGTASPSFDSEDAELQYVLKLSLTEARDLEGTQ